MKRGNGTGRSERRKTRGSLTPDSQKITLPDPAKTELLRDYGTEDASSHKKGRPHRRGDVGLVRCFPWICFLASAERRLTRIGLWVARGRTAEGSKVWGKLEFHRTTKATRLLCCDFILFNATPRRFIPGVSIFREPRFFCLNRCGFTRVWAVGTGSLGDAPRG